MLRLLASPHSTARPSVRGFGIPVVPPWCRKPLFEVTLLLMIAAGMLFQVSAQATALLDKAATEPNFRDRLETEARELTEIGNRFMIRHTEMDKVPIADSAHVDYLFQRMFALIRLLLKASGRG